MRVSVLCDVDSEILDYEADQYKKRNEKVSVYRDFRKILDDKHIDAVVIATPNHWHALMGIWALQAGKDVYLEKPISHNIREGRKLVEAARKYKQIIQSGIQSRSDQALNDVFTYLHSGELGEIKAAYGLCYKRRKSIGKVNGPQMIPRSVDYNLWTGPAALEPLRRTSFHYDWHWLWNTGNGDIGNQGAHQMDMCRRALGEKSLPSRVMSFGGRFGYDDDGDTPNTQVAIFDYEKAPLIFEVQALPRKRGDSSMNHYNGIRIGIVILCEGGYFAGSSGGGWIFDHKGNKIKQFSSYGGQDHTVNFIEVMRSRKVSDLAADIEEGHLSSALCHMGNISYRLGHLSSQDKIKEAIKSHPESGESLRRFQENLFYNWIDVSSEDTVLGPWLTFDPDQEKFIDEDHYNISFWANKLLTRNYRAPFIVPENV